MVKRYEPFGYINMFDAADVLMESDSDGSWVRHEDHERLAEALNQVLNSEPSMDAETGEYGLFVSPETVKMVRKVMEEQQ